MRNPIFRSVIFKNWYGSNRTHSDEDAVASETLTGGDKLVEEYDEAVKQLFLTELDVTLEHVDELNDFVNPVPEAVSQDQFNDLLG